MTFFLSTDILKRLWPHASPTLIAGVSSTSAAVLPAYGIDELPNLIDFMAECSEETGGGILLEEDGDYSASRAHAVWPSLFPTVASAVAYADSPQALFNRVYGGRYGNRPGTDDGYAYRGGGLIQLTFRGDYEAVGKVTGLDLVNHPELARDPSNALEVAAGYWKYANVSALADAGNFTGEVIRIDGGTINIGTRRAWRAICAKVLTLEAVTAPDAPAVAPAPAAPAAAPPVPAPVAPGPASPEARVAKIQADLAAKGPATMHHVSLLDRIEAVIAEWL